jgi:hypothetical protein
MVYRGPTSTAQMLIRRCTPFIIAFVTLVPARSGATSTLKGTVVNHPEQFSGLWESDDGHGGAVGINLELTTEIKGLPRSFAGWPQYWYSLQIGVYQRHGTEQHIGDSNWVVDDSSESEFDGRRLTVKSPSVPIDLTLVYEPEKEAWSGWFHRKSFSGQVVLKRPKPGPGVANTRLAGTWLEGSNHRTCLHVTKQFDGGLAAWSDRLSLSGLDRYAPGIVPLSRTSERYGVLASAEEPGQGVLKIGGSPYTASPVWPPLILKLSAKGDRLTGKMEGADDLPSAIWQKVQGDSCLGVNSK